MRAEMTIDEFQKNLDRWGSTLKAWPEPARSQGLLLLDESEKARQQHQHAQDIDGLLAADHPAPPGMQQQILSQLTSRQGSEDDLWQRLADWFAAPIWKPTLAAACILALSFTAGFLGGSQDLTNSDLEAASMLAFFDNYQEIENAL
jgi:hypothetical protein